MSSSFCAKMDITLLPKRYNDMFMANFLKIIRKDRGFTQEELADKMGVTHVTVQRHENGKRQMNWETIQRYARALECHPTDITDGPGETIAARNEDEKDLLQAFRGLSDSAKKLQLHILKSLEDKGS